MSSLHELVSGDAQQGVTAVLGPTNTGKTHLALERMLRHRSGMIGLPLRLLAREVYDKLVGRVGEGSVALVTGEEKRVPPRARYFVCTVEAMPVERPVAFLAVDEIQLVSHRTRGHVFTDRLLRARGALETLFLGSSTARPVIQALVPTAEILGQPRLSRLSHAGHAPLKRLPERTAVVAFSAARVYELAERLRRQHGGTAVVLGALSPRTRNAQVGLYQGGDVPILVATDAIGMGLNMDVDHVAFAETSKFDGRSRRPLHDDELAQIAGRAGRFMQDGTFGTTASAGPLEQDTIEAIENHRFPPIRRAWWRNADLDFSHLDDLIDSLEVPPRRRMLKRMADAEDHLSLQALARDPAVLDRAHGEDRLRLLWEVAGIPDYRKTLTGHHTELLAELFAHLCDHGELPAGWVEDRLRRLDRTDGDIGALMTRIAHVRTWTFVSHKDAWVRGPRALQERTRLLEDRLSDALHHQLTARFVDHRVGIYLGQDAPPPASVDDQGQVLLGERVVGRIEGLEVVGGLPHGRAGEVAGAAVAEALRARALELVADADEAFEIDAQGRITWREHPVGRWRRGPSNTQPQVGVRGLPDLADAHRAAIRLRLQRLTTDRLEGAVPSLRQAERMRLSDAARALVAAVQEGLGVGPPAERRSLSDSDRRGLARLSIRLGVHTSFVPDALNGPALELRAALFAAAFDRRPVLPADNAVSTDPGVTPAFWDHAGWPVCGPLAIRADVLEKVSARLRREARKGPFALPQELPSWLGTSRETAIGVVDALGYRHVQVAGEARFVPPHAPRRRRR